MHRIVLTALFASAACAAVAQQAPAPRGITREQFVQRGAEMAGRRFDAIDANHTGTITREQIRAYRQAHQRGGAAPAE